MVKDKRIKKIIKGMVDKIVKEYKPEKIILCGSYAYGNSTRDSDIDMLIIKRIKKKSMERWVFLKMLTHDLDRGIPFTPLVFTPSELEQRLSMGDDYIKTILEEGIVLYEKDARLKASPIHAKENIK